MKYKVGDIAYISNLMYVLKVEIREVNEKNNTYKVTPIGIDLTGSIKDQDIIPEALADKPGDLFTSIITNSIRYGYCGKNLGYTEDQLQNIEFRKVENDKDNSTNESK